MTKTTFPVKQTAATILQYNRYVAACRWWYLRKPELEKALWDIYGERDDFDWDRFYKDRTPLEKITVNALCNDLQDAAAHAIFVMKGAYSEGLSELIEDFRDEVLQFEAKFETLVEGDLNELVDVIDKERSRRKR